MKPAIRSLLTGCRFGAIAAIVVTLITPCLVYFAPAEGEFAWDIGLIWNVIIMGPAYHLCRVLGGHWSDPSHGDVSRTFLGFVVTLVVNVMLYAMIAGLLGSIFGWLGRLLERYSVRDDNAA